MKFFWKGEQEGEGWEEAQRQQVYWRAVRSSLNRGCKESGKDEVSRYPAVFPRSLDK